MNKEYEEAKNDYEDGEFMVKVSKILGLASLVAISYIGIRTQLGPDFFESLKSFLENYDSATPLQKTDTATSYISSFFTPLSAYYYAWGYFLKKKNKQKAYLYNLDYRHNKKLKKYFES